MKKKILLILLVIIGLFTITGCSSKSTESGENTNKSSRFDTEANVDDLYFKYISMYSLGDTTNGKTDRKRVRT